MADALKHMFDASRYRRLAADLAAIEPRFDRKRFLALTLRGLGQRTLLERLHQTTVACDAALPGNYREKLAVLRLLAPRIGHPFVAIFTADFVSQYGLEDFDVSLEALRFFTRFGSSEFAVRAFIERDQDRTLEVMTAWASDPDEHVRRLASEGSRPRLPWGRRLASLVRDPAPTLPILSRLRSDPSLYVRKSVANHLNDISKDHPEWMVAQLRDWGVTAPHPAWIAKRAARTLIKAGHPAALRLFRFNARPAVQVVGFRVVRQNLELGEALEFLGTVNSTAPRPQRLVIDYVVHYVKQRGGTAPKVFKLTEVDLAPNASLTVKKHQVLRDFTTRKHHPGLHRIELKINGTVAAKTHFLLRIA